MFLIIALISVISCYVEYNINVGPRYTGITPKLNNITYFNVSIPEDLPDTYSLYMTITFTYPSKRPSTTLVVGEGYPTLKTYKYKSNNMTSMNMQHLAIYYFDDIKNNHYRFGLHVSSIATITVQVEEFLYYDMNQGFFVNYPVEPKLLRFYHYEVQKQNMLGDSNEPVIYGIINTNVFENLDVYIIKNDVFDPKHEDYGGRKVRSRMVLETSIKEGDVFYWLVKNKDKETHFIQVSVDQGKDCPQGCGAMSSIGICNYTLGQCICNNKDGFWGSDCSVQGCEQGKDCSNSYYYASMNCNNAASGFCEIKECKGSFFYRLNHQYNYCEFVFLPALFVPLLLVSLILGMVLGVAVGLILCSKFGKRRYYHVMFD